jgi:hypothetical protein
MQSAFVQHSLVAMHPLPQIFCPVGQVQPPVVQSCPVPQAGEPLHVQVPLVHVLVVMLAQSLLVQHSVDGMHEPLHTFCPDGHAQPAPVQTIPETHGMSPLQVHVPALHVLVDDAVQSPLVQHSDDGMQLEPHFLVPVWQVQVPSLHTPPLPQSEFAQQPDAVVHCPMHSDWPLGHVHVPVRQVCPPLQSCVVQQLEPGMHAAWHVLVPEGHWHVLLALQSSPSPQLALAQQGRFRVPQPPAEPSLPASEVAASFPASLEVASGCALPVSSAT